MALRFCAQKFVLVAVSVAELVCVAGVPPPLGVVVVVVVVVVVHVVALQEVSVVTLRVTVLPAESVVVDDEGLDVVEVFPAALLTHVVTPLTVP